MRRRTEFRATRHHARCAGSTRCGSAPYAFARLPRPRALDDGPWPLAEPIAFRVAEIALTSTVETRGTTSEVAVASAPLGRR